MSQCTASATGTGICCPGEREWEGPVAKMPRNDAAEHLRITAYRAYVPNSQKSALTPIVARARRGAHG